MTRILLNCTVNSNYRVRALLHELNIKLCKTKIMTKNKTF